MTSSRLGHSWLGIVLVAALTITCAEPRRVAQEHLDERSAEAGQPVYFVDWAGFMGTDSLSRLEIYYQVFNFGLQFQKDSTGFEAHYLFRVTVDDKDGRQVIAQEQDRRVRTEEYNKTLTRFDYRTSQMNFNLPPGEYKITCALKDEGSKGEIKRSFPARLRNFRTGTPCMSDIQFAKSVVPSGSEKSIFRKGDNLIVPLPSRYYGDEDSAGLQYYFEVYPGNSSGSTARIEALVRSESRGTVDRDTMSLQLTEAVVPQVRTLSLNQFPLGNFELELRLRGQRNRYLDERRESFSLEWTQEGLLKHDFNTALEQLKYIAPSAEIKEIKKLKTHEERLAAFNAFWKLRDPTISTPENETKREFYRRVAYSNRQFRHMRQPGWRTDRGRIYIMHGHPDQIEDLPMEPASPPYQIWHYYEEGPYRRFTFVDENGDGDFRLQFPYDGLNLRPDF